MTSLTKSFSHCFRGFRLFLVFLVSCWSMSGGAEISAASWLRYPAISPDGRWIAFSAQGDLWVVPRGGGRARLLTTHVAYERSPVWTPDGRAIVFASDRHGNFDLFRIALSGGRAQRLTFHSADDEPSGCTPDGKWVLFRSWRQDDHRAAIGLSRMSELYRIPITGGRPQQILTTPAESAVFDPHGRYIAYHDYKGYEDAWRKHHISAVTRDIWIYDTKTKRHRKLTSFRGEDRNPVWSPDGKVLYYLSERSGTFNVWRRDPFAKAKEAGPVQVTRHKLHPVRFLTIARDGTLCYGFNGAIFVKPPGKQPSRVPVRIAPVDRANRVETITLSGDVTEMAVSPNEEEVAFVVRGEVFVTSVDYTTTRRVTSTPEQERSVTWSRDGRSLYYAGERNGSWNLYRSTITREDEDRFASATLLTETVVLQSDDESFQPLMSPDGKKIAYLHNRDEIRLLDLDTKKTSTLVPARWNYSYSDGDIHYAWSPDSRWLAFTYNPRRRWIGDVGIVNVATGKITNITDSGYEEGQPRFSRDGRALLFESDRLGRRSHGSWGSDSDVFAFYLNRAAWEWSNLTKEELERRKKREAKRKKEGPKKKEEGVGEKKDAGSDSRSTTDKKKEKEAKTTSGNGKEEGQSKNLDVQLQDIEYRIKRLTRHSAPLAGFDLSPDGETLVYFAQEENQYDLWAVKLRDRSSWKLASLGDSGTVRFAKDGKSVFVLYGGRMAKVTVPGSGRGMVKPIRYTARMELDRPAERRYLFEHVWRQVKDKFYRADLHGVDWDAMKRNYGVFLDDINNNRDFAELLSEMLGELNASHTGARYYPSAQDQTATLGLLYDVRHRGAGLKVAEVLPRGPADRPESRIRPGVLITHIDGERLTAQTNPWRLLNRKAGQLVRLGLTDPRRRDDWEEVLKAEPPSADGPRRYERWVAGRRRLVQRRSKGRVGYVHVQAMNDASFRRVYRDVLGRNSDKEALILDTRYNGGGWLHDDLVSFLEGRDYLRVVPRGKKPGQFGAEPMFRWSRPVVVVQSESNYSDAHMFPYAFKQLGIGKLVGTPVAGTGTAVWWERLIDPSLVFGIPQVGMLTPQGKFLENLELQPDVEVYNSPESVARGEDRQLARAVDLLLAQLDHQAKEKAKAKEDAKRKKQKEKKSKPTAPVK